MKAQILLITTFLISILTLSAQDNGDFEFGINSGLNLSNVSTSGGESTSSRVSFNIGASGEHYFSDRWGIKFKLIYDNKGWADGFIIDEFFDEITTDFKLNYLSIPIMANWHFGSNRNWYLNFGPYAGVLISAKDSELDMDVKEAFRGLDFGLAYGIGHKFNIGTNTKLFIEYDGQSGLLDVFEENLGNSVSNGRSSFNLGLLFNL